METTISAPAVTENAPAPAGTKTLSPLEMVIVPSAEEISAGVKMGALCVSRLEKTDTFRRNLHKTLGSNIVVESYLEEDFLDLMK